MVGSVLLCRVLSNVFLQSSSHSQRHMTTWNNNVSFRTTLCGAAEPKRRRSSSSSRPPSVGGHLFSSKRQEGQQKRRRRRQQLEQQQQQQQQQSSILERFTIHQVVPPLAPISTSLLVDGTDTSTILSSATTSTATKSSSLERNAVVVPTPLSVVYTNDPLSARSWADKHLFDNNSNNNNDDDDDDGNNTNDRNNDVVVVAVGFDMESSPNLPWRKSKNYVGPATIQLAVNDDALILQIAQRGYGPIHDTLPILEDILVHPSLLMVGVGVDQDFIELYRWYEEHSLFDVLPSTTTDTSSSPCSSLDSHEGNNTNKHQNENDDDVDVDEDDKIQRRTRRQIIGGSPARIDLGGIGAVVNGGTATAGNNNNDDDDDDDNNNNNINSSWRWTSGRTAGLKRLAECILQQDLPKSKKISRSDWSYAPLSDIQIAYAARDAWVAAAVVRQLAVLDNIMNNDIADDDDNDGRHHRVRRFDPTELLMSFHRGSAASTTTNVDGNNDETDGTESTCIADLSKRARLRQQARQQYKALKEKDGKWSVEERILADTLEKEVLRLAPPLPPMFETEESLGIKVY